MNHHAQLIAILAKNAGYSLQNTSSVYEYNKVIHIYTYKNPHIMCLYKYAYHIQYNTQRSRPLSYHTEFTGIFMSSSNLEYAGDSQLQLFTLKYQVPMETIECTDLFLIKLLYTDF